MRSALVVLVPLLLAGNVAVLRRATRTLRAELSADASRPFRVEEPGRPDGGSTGHGHQGGGDGHGSWC